MTQDSYVELVRRLHQHAMQAMPELTVPLDVFAHALAAKLPETDSRRADDIDGDSIYLAIACATGNPSALALFERRYIATIPPALGKLRLDRAELDETLQIVREKLLVSSAEREPRILELAGQGDLGALVRVVAMRTALNLRRASRRRAEDNSAELIDLLADDIDPARTAIEIEGRAVLKRAIESAIGALDPTQRNLLRLHLVERLGIDDIASLHQVHRATAARWLSRLRDQLRQHTRRQISNEHPTAAVDSLLQLVDSRLEISFARLVG